MDNPLNRLTPGERLVLNAICDHGGGYAGAAFALRLAVNTIKQHLVNARRKTGLSNEQMCYQWGRCNQGESETATMHATPAPSLTIETA